MKDISKNCLQLITHFECKAQPEKFLKAYQDTGGVWTIGIGTTIYPDDIKVKEGDEITLDEAYEFLTHDIKTVVAAVDSLTTKSIEQHQFDALVSFAYNEGINRYRKSTLRNVINKNSKDYKAIVEQMLLWKYDNHIEQPGLLRRRKAEANLYVYGELRFYFLPNNNIV